MDTPIAILCHFLSGKQWNKLAVLALWKSAKPTFVDTEPTLHETRSVINTGHLDYIRGRSLKLGNVKQDWPFLRSNLYNRDNGEGLMESVSKTHNRQGAIEVDRRQTPGRDNQAGHQTGLATTSAGGRTRSVRTKNARG